MANTKIGTNRIKVLNEDSAFAFSYHNGDLLSRCDVHCLAGNQAYSLGGSWP